MINLNPNLFKLVFCSYFFYFFLSFFWEERIRKGKEILTSFSLSIFCFWYQTQGKKNNFFSSPIFSFFTFFPFLYVPSFLPNITAKRMLKIPKYHIMVCFCKVNITQKPCNCFYCRSKKVYAREEFKIEKYSKVQVCSMIDKKK